MKFNSKEDVKSLMKMILEKLDKCNELYDDFEWYSNVNYTTTTEYYGELRNFLEKLIELGCVPAYKNEVLELYYALNSILSVKGEG